jgi:hypothetical protein
MLLSLDGDHHFVKVPFVGKSTFRSRSNAAGILAAELAGPFRHCLEGNLDAAFGEQVFDVTQAERKPEIQPHRVADDLGRKAVALSKHAARLGKMVGHTLRTKPHVAETLRRRYHPTDHDVVGGLTCLSANH